MTAGALLPALEGAVRRVALALALLALVGAGPLPAQDGFRAPEVEAALEAGPRGGVLLRLRVPEGWLLYTPGAGPVGLPLEVEWTVDGRPAAPRVLWPEGDRHATAAGPTRVWRGEVEAPVAGLPRGSAGTLLTAEVRWAVCRGELCVPGRSRAVTRLVARR